MFSALKAIAAAMALLCASACATSPPPAPHDLAEQRMAMQKFAFLVGHWRGDARFTRPDGTIVNSRSEDVITLIDNGTILLVHGRAYAPGAAPDAAPISENLGVFTYDDVADRYHLHTYASGASQSGDVRSIGDGAAQWVLPISGGIIRFDITADGPDGWIEDIHRSSDNGHTWTPMMNIRFTRAPAS